jgi:hypothetical protein
MVDHLATNDWLHDEIIDSFIRHFELDELGTSRIFTTSFMTKLKLIHNETANWGSILRMLLGGKQMKDSAVLLKDFLVFPTGNANSNGKGSSHWGLCIIAYPRNVHAVEQVEGKLPCIIFVDPLGHDKTLVE